MLTEKTCTSKSVWPPRTKLDRNPCLQILPLLSAPSLPFPRQLFPLIPSLSILSVVLPPPFYPLVCFKTPSDGGHQDTSLGRLFSALEQSILLNRKGVSSWRRYCSHSWNGVQVPIIHREMRA